MANVIVDIIGKDSFSGVANKAVGSVTEFASAISTLEKGLGYAQKAFDATVGETVSYANEVRGLQQVTGASAEETSRLIQVLDDFKVSSTAAASAQRYLTKQGIVLTTESLADLSAQYLKITDQAERNAFAQKMLGRNYKDFVEVLQQGPEAIKEASDAIDENLVLTQKSIDEARQYEKELDNLNDAFGALKVSIGTNFLPVVVDSLKIIEANIQAISKMPGTLEKARQAMDAQGAANDKAAAGLNVFADVAAEIVNATLPSFMRGNNDLATSTGTATSALADETDAAEEAAAKQKALTDALNATTAANTSLLSVITNVSSENQNYDKSMAGLIEKGAELQTKLDTLKQQGWWPTSQAVQDVTKDIDNNKQAIQDLETAHDAAMKKIAWNLLVSKLQADGFTDAEFKIALQAGISAGVLDEKSAAMAANMNDLATRASDAAGKIGGIGREIDDLPSSKTIDITVKVNSDRLDLLSEIKERAAGGAGAGLTMVGERGPELVRLPGGSHVYPNSQSQAILSNGGGSGVNININVASGGIIADPQEFARQITPSLRYALRSMGVI